MNLLAKCLVQQGLVLGDAITVGHLEEPRYEIATALVAAVD